MARGETEIEEAPAKSEGRRQETRQAYKANATLSRAGTATLHQAAVIDLSCSGCLLRIGQKSDFEVEDTIELSVQSSDLSFRARGTIRPLREEGVLLGIRLESLTTRGRTLLNEVIKELEAGILVSV